MPVPAKPVPDSRPHRAHIIAWCQVYGFSKKYIEDMVKKAERDDAPWDAVYHLRQKDWVRFADLPSTYEVDAIIDKFAKHKWGDPNVDRVKA